MLAVLALELIGWFLFLGFLITILAYLFLIIIPASSSSIATGSRREILYSGRKFESVARCLLRNETGPRGGASWILSMSKLPPRKRQKREWDALSDERQVHASVQRRTEILQGARKALERSVARKAYVWGASQTGREGEEHIPRRLQTKMQQTREDLNKLMSTSASSRNRKTKESPRANGKKIGVWSSRMNCTQREKEAKPNETRKTEAPEYAAMSGKQWTPKRPDRENLRSKVKRKGRAVSEGREEALEVHFKWATVRLFITANLEGTTRMRDRGSETQTEQRMFGEHEVSVVKGEGQANSRTSHRGREEKSGLTSDEVAADQRGCTATRPLSSAFESVRWLGIHSAPTNRTSFPLGDSGDQSSSCMVFFDLFVGLQGRQSGIARIVHKNPFTTPAYELRVRVFELRSSVAQRHLAR
ncbi:hypothetical protein K438DRAFT_1782088 [Mycena galopus ATCC 62051]|nr:hypothetical protein K438DRAFT_1782088 [Mycena galopus ATCC 62051]